MLGDRPFRIARGLSVLMVFACLCGHATTALAWTAFGHRLIARLAQSQLSPNAASEVEALLAQESTRDLASIAAWADEVRELPAYRATGPFHYVNFAPGTCRYVPKRDCREGACIIAALSRYTATLSDRSKPDAERLEALKFVVHLVGDVHQPLHAGNREDRGGNQFQIQVNGKGSNLHAVWDYDILKRDGMGLAAWQRALAPRVELVSAGANDALAWAEQSCELIDDFAIYPSRPGKLPKDYLTRMRPLAETQVVLASTRLALVLEQALGAPDAVKPGRAAAGPAKRPSPAH